MTTQDVTLYSMPTAFRQGVVPNAVTLQGTFLPPASPLLLGAIQVGSNLNIDSAGLLSYDRVIGQIESYTGYITASQPFGTTNVIQVSYAGDQSVDDVSRDFPAGTIITTEFTDPQPAVTEYTVADVAITSPSVGLFNITLTQAIPPFVIGVEVVRIRKNVNPLKFSFGALSGIGADNFSINYNANGQLSLIKSPSSWLTGFGTPADDVGSFANYYQDTSARFRNRIWLKTQIDSPDWQRQIALENTCRTALGGFLVFGFARVTSRTNITLSGLQTIDGVALIVGDIVLVQGQTNSANNGLYVATTTFWERQVSPVIEYGLVVFVSEGTLNFGDSFIQTSPITTVGISPQTWTVYSESFRNPTLESVCFSGDNTTTSLTTGASILTGYGSANYFSLTTVVAPAMPSLTVLGASSNIDLICKAGGSGAVLLGNSLAGKLSLRCANAGSPLVISATGVTNQNLHLYAPGSGTLFFGNAAAGQLNILGRGSFLSALQASGVTNQNLQISGGGSTGSVILGGVGNNGLIISNSSADSVTLSAKGSVAKIDVVVNPKGSANTYLIGASIPATGDQPKIYLPASVTSTTFGPGASEQLIESGAPLRPVHWSDAYLPWAYYTITLATYSLTLTTSGVLPTYDALNGPPWATIEKKGGNLDLTLNMATLTGFQVGTYFIQGITHLRDEKQLESPDYDNNVTSYRATFSLSTSTTTSIAGVTYGGGTTVEANLDYYDYLTRISKTVQPFQIKASKGTFVSIGPDQILYFTYAQTAARYTMSTQLPGPTFQLSFLIRQIR